MPWGIWLSVTLKAKTKIILWKLWKGWDCFSRCSGLPSRPVTLPLHPLSEPHYCPLKPLIDCSGCTGWDLCPPSSPWCFPSSPSPPLPNVLLCAPPLSNVLHKHDSGLPPSHWEERHSHISSKPQRQQKLNRPWGSHMRGPSLWDKKSLSTEPAESRQDKYKQTEKVECCQVDRKSTLIQLQAFSGL